MYWGAVFFLRSVHTFSWFLKSNWSSDFGHAEIGSGAKKWVKVEWENGVWTEIRFLASGFLFIYGIITLIFTVFSIYWSDFFLNGFPNPLIVNSSPSFLFEPNFYFSLVVFASNMGNSLWFLLFFRIFGSDLFLNGDPNSLLVHFRSSFLFSQWKFFELYVRICPAMFFYFLDQLFVWRFEVFVPSKTG